MMNSNRDKEKEREEVLIQLNNMSMSQHIFEEIHKASKQHDKRGSGDVGCRCLYCSNSFFFSLRCLQCRIHKCEFDFFFVF